MIYCAKRPVRLPVVLSETLVQPLQAHLGRVRTLNRHDLAQGNGEVSLPHAPRRKYPRPVSGARGIAL